MTEHDEPQQFDEPSSAPQQVDRLEAGMGGVWLVSSARETTHVWDLDAMTYRRQPGPGSSDTEYDHTNVAITRVSAWPQVGARSLVYLDDPESEGWEQWRMSSTIRRISRIGWPVATPTALVVGAASFRPHVPLVRRVVPVQSGLRRM